MVKVFFRTFGCSTNFSETEVMKGLLKEADFEIVNNEKNAFLIVLNICTVKTDTLALREIRRIVDSYPNKKLIVAGCIPAYLTETIREIAPDAGLINTHNIREVVAVAEETINDNPIAALAKSSAPKINLPKIRKNRVIGIVPISNSCLGNCSYCSVKSIKGKFQSYPVESIVAEVKQCLKDGCREIWITAQDTGCYGADINTNLVELLKEILKINYNFKIRLGMANPDHVKEMVDDLIEIYKNDKMFKFLHIPVQSGNDKILKSMRRNYTVEEFKEIVSKFRKEIPEITISTDMICGFPSETKEQFMDSKKLVEEIKPDILNISKFRARQGTAAAKKKQVEGAEIKTRSKYLTSTFDWVAYETNKKWKDWQGEILIDEKGKEDTFVGRNYCYKPVVVKGNLEMGAIVRAKIVNITKHDLRGELI